MTQRVVMRPHSRPRSCSKQSCTIVNIAANLLHIRTFHPCRRTKGGLTRTNGASSGIAAHPRIETTAAQLLFPAITPPEDTARVARGPFIPAAKPQYCGVHVCRMPF